MCVPSVDMKQKNGWEDVPVVIRGTPC